jgi:hypothetical protein
VNPEYSSLHLCPLAPLRENQNISSLLLSAFAWNVLALHLRLLAPLHETKKTPTKQLNN